MWLVSKTPVVECPHPSQTDTSEATLCHSNSGIDMLLSLKTLLLSMLITHSLLSEREIAC